MNYLQAVSSMKYSYVVKLACLVLGVIRWLWKAWKIVLRKKIKDDEEYTILILHGICMIHT